MAVRLAAAEAKAESRYAAEGEAVIKAIRAFSSSQPRTGNQQFLPCPVCDYHGISTGWHDIRWEARGLGHYRSVTGSRPVGMPSLVRA